MNATKSSTDYLDTELSAKSRCAVGIALQRGELANRLAAELPRDALAPELDAIARHLYSKEWKEFDEPLHSVVAADDAAGPLAMELVDQAPANPERFEATMYAAIDSIRQNHRAREARQAIADAAERTTGAGPDTVHAEAARLHDDLRRIEAEGRGGNVYAVRPWGEIVSLNLPPKELVWGGIYLDSKGAAIFGQGGLGKTRLSMNIARNQVLTIPFAGLPVGNRPLRHLFMGSENNLHRLQHDIRRMELGLDESQCHRLNDHIRLATLEGADDFDITLATPANIRRWTNTLAAWPPDVLWVDPWGDILDGESNSDDAARDTIKALRRVLLAVNPRAVPVILAHARTGARNIAQAIGYDAANFGKGSKALYSSVRCVWNMAPGDESDSPPIVCVHAKHNDSRGEKPFALRLDDSTMTYERDESFDFDDWMESVGRVANGKRKAKSSPTMSDDKAMEILGNRVETTHDAQALLRHGGATKAEAENIVQKLLASQRWARWQPHGKNQPKYIGTPENIALHKKAFAERAQGTLA